VTNSYWLRQIGGKAYIHQHSTTEDEDEAEQRDGLENKDEQRRIATLQRSSPKAQPVEVLSIAVTPAFASLEQNPSSLSRQSFLQRERRDDAAAVASTHNRKKKEVEEEDPAESKRRKLAAAVARQELLHYGWFL
jgi:hypothetical protein